MEPFATGDLLNGAYAIRELLGRGGMSYVYEADDVLLRRRVAIKVAGDPALGATMLLHEARALATVRHPGLPAIHGVATHDGWTYLAIERLYGRSLEDRLQGPLAPIEAARILCGVADALAAVHGAGMVHHDLKPANVMLCANRIVLLDFGIMTPEVEARGPARCGTPQYLAPESILGTVHPPSAHLIDTYALGVMAFEMLAGRPPFEAAEPADIFELHLGAPIPDLRSIRTDLPEPLVALVESCLAKEPADRPPVMEAVLWDLRRIVRRLDVQIVTGPLQVAREQ